MSILLKEEIIEAMNEGLITGYSKPLNPKDFHIGPNSVDVTLNKVLKVYFEPIIEEFSPGMFILKKKEKDKFFNFIDLKKENKTYKVEIPEEGLILLPGHLYLGSTNEAIGSYRFIPMYEGRSSMARAGIKSHISAGFGDIGFDARWTLEIEVTEPVKIYPNMRIGQVYFMKVNENKIGSNIYQGKYKNQQESQETKSFLDFS